MRPPHAVKLPDPHQVRRRQRLLRRLGRNHHDPLHARHLCGNRRHQQRRWQRMPPARHVTSHRSQRPHHLPACQPRLVLAPVLRHLLLREPANLLCRRAQSLLQRGTRRLPRRRHLLARHAKRLASRQPVQSRRVPQQRAIALLAHGRHNPPHVRHHAIQRRAAAVFQFRHQGSRLACAAPLGPNQFHRSPRTPYSTTLFSGYSTIPVAFAAFSRGITSRAVRSSRIVFTATHSELLNCDTVGEFSAGSTASTASRSARRTFSISPTCDCASMAPRSISAIWSIFSFFHASPSAARLAIRCVSLSITVSMIFSRFAFSELPVSVTSKMASASIGGFTSVAPQLNSTFTFTPFAAK